MILREMVIELRMIAYFQQRNDEVNRNIWIIHGRLNYLGLKRFCHCLNAVFQGKRDLAKILFPNLVREWRGLDSSYNFDKLV